MRARPCDSVQTFIEIEGGEVADAQVDLVLARTSGVLIGGLAVLLIAGRAGCRA
jgi:hypothetical protein